MRAPPSNCDLDPACEDRFKELAAAYRERKVAISADAPEEKDRALKVLKEKQVSATNYLFSGNDKYQLMDAVDSKAAGNLPHTILVAPGSKVLYRKSGACEPLEIKKAIVGHLGRVYP